MIRVLLMAVAMGLLGLVVAVPLVRGTKLFRGLTDGQEEIVIVMFFLTGTIVGAIAGATDSILLAIYRKDERQGPRSQT